MRILAAVLLATVAAAADPWLTDHTAALAEAKASGRDLLIDFTGSDWCSWCIKLDGEVLSHQAFLEPAARGFVLLKLDFLRKTPLPPERQAELEALRERYEVKGFPTILLCDAAGAPYARTGYLALTPEAYAARLQQVRAQRGREPELRAQAEAASGLDRARAFAALIEHRELMGLEAQPGLLEAAVAADPEGALPGTAARRSEIAERRLGSELSAAEEAKDTATLLRLINGGIADVALRAEFRQRLQAVRGMMAAKADPQAARADFTAALALAPDSQLAAQISKLLQALDQPAAP